MKALWLFILVLIVLASLTIGCGTFKHQSRGFQLDGQRCNVSQETLDNEVEASGAYEITAEEFCDL